MFSLYYFFLLLVWLLKRLVKFIGLFIVVLFNLICNDIELRIFNLCVCNGWDSFIINDFLRIFFVEFVVGEFNNML